MHIWNIGLLGSVAILLLIMGNACGEKIIYRCPPCNQPCDTLTFDSPGMCPHCSMPLEKVHNPSETRLAPINEINIQEGKGYFRVSGGKGKTDKVIDVHYYKPDFTFDKLQVLLVIPGAGRNGDSYRDAWVEEADRNRWLILSPTFREEDYPFEHYHLCGLIDDINLQESATYSDSSNEVYLAESTLRFDPVVDIEKWIFNDLDRIFLLVKDEFGLDQSKYNVFGHSAGGQILHRMALLHNGSLTGQIIAANSGFYTLPDTTTSLPFGLKDFPFSEEQMKRAFQNQVVILSGELDNAEETGGTLLRSTSADIQGMHRNERAHFFFNYAQEMAKEKGIPFHWKLVEVPNVGHDHRGMGKAAAKYLEGLSN